MQTDLLRATRLAPFLERSWPGLHTVGVTRGRSKPWRNEHSALRAFEAEKLMSIMNALKRMLIGPLSRSVPTVKVGTADTWRIMDILGENAFVVAAGVGKNITFELDMARR